MLKWNAQENSVNGTFTKNSEVLQEPPQQEAIIHCRYEKGHRREIPDPGGRTEVRVPEDEPLPRCCAKWRAGREGDMLGLLLSLLSCCSSSLAKLRKPESTGLGVGVLRGLHPGAQSNRST